jgi:hypothetical protein
MLHPDTAMHAIRILGVDTANLMTQMAVYKATVEELVELAVQIDERAWEPLMADDDAPEIIGIKLPPDQQAVLQQILMLIHSLR